MQAAIKVGCGEGALRKLHNSLDTSLVAETFCTDSES